MWHSMLLLCLVGSWLFFIIWFSMFFFLDLKKEICDYQILLRLSNSSGMKQKQMFTFRLLFILSFLFCTFFFGDFNFHGYDGKKSSQQILKVCIEINPSIYWFCFCFVLLYDFVEFQEVGSCYEQERYSN